MKIKLSETNAVHIFRHEDDSGRYLVSGTPQVVRVLSDGDIVLGMRDATGNPVEIRLPSSLVALLACMKMDHREYAGELQGYQSMWP